LGALAACLVLVFSFNKVANKGLGKMIVKIDDNISIEVYFDIADREEGYEDDIYFVLHETGPENLRIFKADSTSILLTPNQAEQLAAGLQEAAQASRETPSKK
jgi:hypothetical protein